MGEATHCVTYIGGLNMVEARSERYLSPVLRHMPPDYFRAAPLSGVEARIYDRLCRRMAERKLRPGFKLREDVIGDVFGVSRTIVRKVLVILEQEGILDLPANRGAFVALPSREDAESTHEAVEMALSRIVEKLCVGKRLSGDGKKQLAQHLQAQMDADRPGKADEARILASEFWVLLAALYGNRVLTHLVSVSIMRLEFSLIRFAVLEPRLDCAGVQQSLAGLISDGRTDEAVRLVKEHFASLAGAMIFEEDRDEVDLRSLLGSDLVS